MNSFIEVPANKTSLAKRSLVQGVGINNAAYIVTMLVDNSRVICPYYQVWMSMINRCYSEKYQKKQPTYKGCSVVDEWLSFTAFREWMEKQDWNGKELDKDILNYGNKKYSQDSCIFVSKAINNLLSDNGASRGAYPQGVSFSESRNRYRATCVVDGAHKFLGRFKTCGEAEIAYLKFKSSLINSIAYRSEAKSNLRLQSALLLHSDRYLSNAKRVENEQA